MLTQRNLPKKSNKMKSTLRFAIISSLFILTSITVYSQSNLNRDAVLKEISVFPQPSTGLINLLFAEMPSQNPHVQVYDLLGNMVADLESERQSAYVYAIDLSNKKPGYYFVKIRTDKDSWSRRITIKP